MTSERGSNSDLPSFATNRFHTGQTQTLVEMRVDCDQDAFLAFVRVGGDGGACHTGRRSCFYRRVETGGDRVRLAFVEG